MDSQALWLCLASALAWGVFDALRKGLARQLDAESLVIRLCLGMAPLAALAVWLRGEPLPAPAYLLPGTLALVLGVVANLLFMQALRLSPLSLLPHSPYGPSHIRYPALDDTINSSRCAPNSSRRILPTRSSADPFGGP